MHQSLPSFAYFVFIPFYKIKLTTKCGKFSFKLLIILLINQEKLYSDILRLLL